MVPTISIRYVPLFFRTNPSRSSRLASLAAQHEVRHSLRPRASSPANSDSSPSSPSSPALNVGDITISNDSDSVSETVSEDESEAHEGDDHFNANPAESPDEECEEEEGDDSDSSDTLRAFPTPSAEIARDLAAYRASLRAASSSASSPNASYDWPPVPAMRGWTEALQLATDAMRSHSLQRVSTRSEHSDSDSEDSDSDSDEDVEDDDEEEDGESQGNEGEDARRRVLVDRVLAARAGERAAERAELAAWKRAHPQAPTYVDFYHQDRDTRDAWELAYRGGWRISEATRERARRNAEIRGLSPEMEREGLRRGDTSRHPVYVGQASSVARGSRSAASAASAETLAYGPSVGRADVLAQVQATRRAAIEAANKRFWAERELGLFLLRQSHLQVDGGCQALESGLLLI